MQPEVIWQGMIESDKPSSHIQLADISSSKCDHTPQVLQRILALMFHVNGREIAKGIPQGQPFFQKLKEFVCVLVRGRHHLKFLDEGANHTVCLHLRGAHSINPSCHEQRSNQRLIEYCNNRQCYECQPVRRDMEEEVYHAGWQTQSRDTKILNGVAGVTIAVAIVFLFLGITLGEVVKSDGASEIDRGVRVPVWERGGQRLHYQFNKRFCLRNW